MKKITLIIIMFFISFCNYAQLAQEGFEGTWGPLSGSSGAAGPDGWAIKNVSGPVKFWVQATGEVAQPAFEGSHAAFLNQENVANGTNAEDWLITKAFPMPQNAQLRFHSKLFLPGNQGSQYKIMISSTIGDVDVQTNAANFTEVTSWTELTLNPSQADWTEKIVSLTNLSPAIAPGTPVYIAFVMLNDNGDRWDIDNVKVISECLDPINLSAPVVSTTSANLNWDSPGGATSWEIEVLPADASQTGTGIPYSGALPFVATTTATGTALTPNTPYKYYVRAICGEDNVSNWVGPFNFSSGLCDNQCNYTFILQSEFSVGWLGATMNVVQNGITMATLGPSFTTGASQSVTVPLCSNIPFDVFWSDSGFFTSTVGLTIKNSFGQTLYNMEPESAEPETIIYSHMANCATPECFAPTGLGATSTGSTTATLTWDNTAGANWEYYYTETGGAMPTTAGTPTAVNTVTISGLTTNTVYDYYVRTMCGGGSTSEWAGPFHFGSVCDPSNQCNYTFNLLSMQEQGWQGNTMTISQSGIAMATIGADFITGGSQNVTVPLCTDVPFDVTWNEGADITWMVGLSISNNFGQNIFSLDFNTQSPGLIFSGVATCNTPLCEVPTGLTVTQTDMTTATLAWDGINLTWDYYIAAAGSLAPQATTTPTGTTTVNPVTVTNLTPSTEHEYYLRVVCNNGTTGWAGPIAFSTTACAPEDKCIFSFEMYKESGLFSSDSYEGNTMTIFQGGIAIATIGPQFTAGSSQIVEIALCPGMPIEIFWNEGGFNSPDKGLRIYNPEHEIVFTKPGGTGAPGSIVFSGILECAPAACPAPQNLTVSDVTLTSASLSWTEMGTATAWEVFLLPIGNGVPGPDDVGTLVTAMPYTPVLLPNTPYQFFVRAVCGENNKSRWSDYGRFTTPITNDGCSGAISIPVNPTTDCVQYISGTCAGATESGSSASCLIFGPPADVWYSFVATATEHTVRFTDVVNTMLSFVVYEGDDCGNMTEIFCNNLMPSGYLPNLTPGQTYYIMAFSLFDNGGPNGYNLCVATPTPVLIDNTQYTVPELVSEVLVNSLCSSVSNITWRSGVNPQDTTGIGMFTKGESGFPIDKGVVLATHNVTEILGPNTSTLNNDPGWDGDDDLFNYITGLGIDFNLQQYVDASVLEFDFVPHTGHIQFPFIFASEEYGMFQCSFSDAFAFFLTKPDGTIENLAVIPDTNIPVSVVTIRDEGYNTDFFGDICDSANPEWFDSYYGGDTTMQPGLDPLTAPINFNGYTKKLVAESDVIIGETYHIKLVIADRNDWGLNSAVYIGEFGIGSVDLGPDKLVATNTALCAGQNVVLNTDKDPSEYTFKWYFNDTEIEGQTGPTLSATQEGTYTVTIHYGASTCETSDSVVIEFYDAIGNTPQDLSECSTNGFSLFNLAGNTPVLLNGYNAADYTVTYHLTQADAEAGQAALTTSYTNTIQYEQTIFARIVNLITGCIEVKPFKIKAPSTVIPAGEVANVAACNSYTLPVLTIGNYFTASGGTGSSLAAGTQITTTQTLYVYASGGESSACHDEKSFTVTILPVPQLVITEGCNSNNQYELQAGFPDGSITDDNAHFQWTNAQGQPIGNNASLVVTETGLYNVNIIPDSDTICPATGTITVTGIVCGIPRGISPNNDGLNDEFDLAGLDVDKIVIYNRYGKEVYHKSHYTNQWHGQQENGNELPTATYFYVIQFTDGKSKTGWVYLNREN